jgi:hypothetical protein
MNGLKNVIITEEISKTKSQFFEQINKVDKPVAQLTQR